MTSLKNISTISKHDFKKVLGVEIWAMRVWCRRHQIPFPQHCGVESRNNGRLHLYNESDFAEILKLRNKKHA